MYCSMNVFNLHPNPQIVERVFPYYLRDQVPALDEVREQRPKI